MADFEIYQDDTEGEPLIPEECGAGRDELLIYDEEGSLEMNALFAQPATDTTPPIARPRPIPFVIPCSSKTLNGSWLLQLVPQGPHLFQQIRGPMRIEVDASRLRISGDIYVKSLLVPLPVPRPLPVPTPVVPNPLVIRKNWYPAFPQKEYRWYFRSAGVSYSGGTLLFKFVRHLWDKTTQEFAGTDNGWMRLKCTVSLIRPIGSPQPTIQMSGEAMIGGRKYNVTATKTSPYYRGCLVEVDVMTNRTWPAVAQSCNGTQSFTFTGVYRSTGLDFRAVVNELNLPEDALLSTAEMHNLLATHRSLSAGGDNWHLWLLVGSRMDGTLGLMFDTGNPPHREGAVGFFDPTLPNLNIIEASARGKKLGEVPLAFLRTLVHEAGHAFNLFHPKHDVHGVPKGTTIMNQTGDVMGFATVNDPFPCNATMAFNDHNRTSLVHSSDPQVKPGWKEFGWGHGSASSGLPEPVDATGLDDGSTQAVGLRLDLDVPEEIARGEFVVATLTVTNEGDAPRQVTTALNLSEGDLRLHVTDPANATVPARDVVIACGTRRVADLAPGDSISGRVQLFYTSTTRLTFDQPGRYKLVAELDVGDGSVVTSAPATVMVRPAATKQERDLERATMDADVGLSLALGDMGVEKETHERVTSIMKKFAKTDIGAACAMVVANSLSRDLRDPRTDTVVRAANKKRADEAFDAATKGADAASLASLASTVVSPRETTAPLLDRVQKLIKKGNYKKADADLATKIISDHCA